MDGIGFPERTAAGPPGGGPAVSAPGLGAAARGTAGERTARGYPGPATRGGFVCIEVKSGLRDYLADAKWTEYQPFCDQFFFAVDADFPQRHPAAGNRADRLRGTRSGPAPRTVVRPSAPARRKALLERFAWLAAGRLAAAGGSDGRGGPQPGLNED